ncbi:MAG: hypothetical protein EAX96_12320 [Candidatus Lokiarchaeota archaeon]|nr:hypothetical protein [Candidatus Lokiarchaeota archaeon]
MGNNEQENYDGIKYIREKKIRKKETKMIQKGLKKPILIKGYMRPDKTSYYVTIPKKVREIFKLKGGEYFLMTPDLMKNRITLELTSFEIYSDEETEEE